jgi:uncharacterized protein YkwD
MDDQSESTADSDGPHQPPPIFPAILFLFTCVLPAIAAEEPPKPPHVEQELKMFGLINADREQHKRTPLKYDDALAAVARAHSADMLKNQFFNHKSPTTGLAADRLFAAKEIVTASGENIATNDAVEKAQAALMKSPGHRKNILQEGFTHCGVGIVQAPNGTYRITQVFAARPPPVKFETLGVDVVRMLNKVRAVRGKRPFEVSPALSRVAAAYVAEVARAGKPVAVDIRARAKAAGVKARRLSTGLVSTWDPAEIAAAAALVKPDKGRIGIAFARNEKHKALGYGIIWVFAVFTDE